MRFSSIFSTVVIMMLAATLSILTGCEPSTTEPQSNSDTDGVNGKSSLTIVATTGQIYSALRHLTEGCDAKLDLLCGPGVDPHSFSASTRDIQAMQSADAIIYNGYHLEAQLDAALHDSFADKSWSMASAFPDEYRLDWIEDGEVDPAAPYDPHLWNHLPGWSKCVEALAEHLAQLHPEQADRYRENAAAYVAEIEQTHQWALERLKQIAADRRFIVSAHDAFNYFAEVYDMETFAVLGIGNDAEADIQTMKRVATEVSQRKIPVIFLEAITNPKVSTALQEACEAQDWNVRIVSQQLYSDDLGEQPPVDTFLGAFRSNVEVIVANLK